MENSSQEINLTTPMEKVLKEEFLKSLRATIYAAIDPKIKKDLIEIYKNAS